MSVKVSFNNVNQEAIEMISDFNVALYRLDELRKDYKTANAKLEEVRKALVEKRQKALETKNLEDLGDELSLAKVMSEIDALEEKYEKDCKPYKDAKSKAIKSLDNNLYYAYLYAMEKGLSSTGTLALKKDKKTGKVTESVKIEKSFAKTIANWLVDIGATCPNDNAIDKFAQIMVAHVAGLKKTSKVKNGYATTKKSNEFKELFLRAFMQITIVEKGVFTMNDDHTVVATVYDAE